MSQIKVIIINTMTMLGREREMVDYLKENELPDVVFSQEVRVAQLKIAGYHVFLGEPSLVRRGSYKSITAVLIKKKWRFRKSTELPVLDHNSGKSTFVLVKERLGRSILVGSMYVPGNTKVGDSQELYTQLMASMSRYDAAIVGGDFNSPGEVMFRNHPENSDIAVVKPRDATHQSGSMLDYFAIKGIGRELPLEKLCVVTENFETNDHMGVSLVLFETLLPLTVAAMQRLGRAVNHGCVLLSGDGKQTQIRYILTDPVLLQFNWTGTGPLKRKSVAKSTVFDIIRGMY